MYIIYKDFLKREKVNQGKIGFAETVSREPDPLFPDQDPRIRIQIRMIRIHNTVLHPVYALPLVLRRAHRLAGTQRAKVVQAKTENIDQQVTQRQRSSKLKQKIIVFPNQFTSFILLSLERSNYSTSKQVSFGKSNTTKFVQKQVLQGKEPVRSPKICFKWDSRGL